MKAGRENHSEEVITNIDNSTSVVKRKKQFNWLKQSSTDKNAVIITILPVIAVIAVACAGLIKQIQGIQILKTGILTLILTAASGLFIRLQEEELLSKKYSKSILIGGYLLSLLLILLPVHPEIYCFWMLGCLSVAMLLDGKLGLLYFFNHTFLLSFTLSLRPDTILYYLVMGVFLCLLSEALKNKTTVIYAAIIILSTNITLAFVINNFLFETSTSFNYLGSFFSIFAVLVIAFLLSSLYDRLFIKDRGEMSENSVQIMPGQMVGTDEGIDASRKMDVSIDVDSDITENSSVLTSDRPVETNKAEEAIINVMSIESLSDTSPETVPAHIYYDRGARTSYELLISDQNGLLKKMKEFSEALYQHCIKIGDLSSRAAKIIHADTILAKAGGLYHEVGKINGKDYIEEGQKIAEEYAFPKELKAILRQHNIKHEKPSSAEAAIVMLSDNVVSTIEYIKKSEDKRYTTDKIIDNLFQLRMEKGTFDESGLSVKDYKTLKEFYQREFRSMD